MNVETIEISQLSADPGNVRTHSDAQIAKLMGALRRWGQTLPLLVDQNNVVRVGNARLEAARRIGWTDVKVVRLNLSPSEWVSLAVADNKLHDDSAFDQAALANVLDALRSEDADLATAAGFSPDELAALFGGSDGDAPVAPPDDFPAYDESLATEHECPRCKFRWSGTSAPAGGAQ